MTEQIHPQEAQAERQPPTTYEAAAEAVLASLAQLPEEGRAERAKSIVQQFVAEVLSDALEGKIASSSSDFTTEAVVLTQFDGYLKELSSGDPERAKQAIMLIPRAEGLRKSFSRLNGDPASGELFRGVLNELVHPDQVARPQAAPDIEALAPAAAAHLIEEIDEEVDHRSAEIAEEEPRVTPEQAEEIGEEALEAAEVDEPVEEGAVDEESEEVFATRAEAIRHTYEVGVAHIKEEVSGDLARAISRLDESVQYTHSLQGRVLSDTHEIAQQLERRLYSDNYPVSALRVLLEQTVHNFEGPARSAYNFSEGVGSEAIRTIDTIVARSKQAHKDAEQIEGDFEDALRSESLEKPADTESVTATVEAIEASLQAAPELRDTFNKLGENFTEFTRGMYAHMEHLETIRQQSFATGMIDPEEIKSVLHGIKQLANDERGKFVRDTVQKVSQLQEAMQHARTELDAHR